MDILFVDISPLRFPVSIILAVAFLALLWCADRFCGGSRAVRALRSGRFAVGLLVAAAILLAVEGSLAVELYRTWPFVALVVLLMASLGLTVLRRLRTGFDWGFVLNHGGIFLILWGAVFGAPDVVEARMKVGVGETRTAAYTEAGREVTLPFGVRLDRFVAEYCDDGSPRLFRSEVHFDGKPAVVEVNAPARCGGYRFYQAGYDERHGSYTVLEVVRNPWIAVVWTGAAMLAAGALILLLGRR